MPLSFDRDWAMKCLQGGLACSHVVCIARSMGHLTGIHRWLHAMPSVQDPLMPSGPLLGDVVGNDMPRAQTNGAKGPWGHVGTPLQRHAQCRCGIFLPGGASLPLPQMEAS